MTLPFSRRSRERRAAIAGDFPDTGESITEILQRVKPDGYDDTLTFTGASAGTMPPAEARREAGLRQAVEMTDPATAPLTWLRARPQDIPPARPSFTPQPPAGPRDTGPMPKLSRYAARTRPQRPADGFIPAWSGLLGQHIMLCGVCPPERRNRYADPIAATMPFEFEALRVSAWTSGWRLDAFDRWGCPACQLTSRWHARYTVRHYDDRAPLARLAGDEDGERWWRAAAEHALIRDVAAAANHGKHRVTS